MLLLEYFVLFNRKINSGSYVPDPSLSSICTAPEQCPTDLRDPHAFSSVQDQEPMMNFKIIDYYYIIAISVTMIKVCYFFFAVIFKNVN